MYECDGCGACCQSFPIFASREDAAREPRIAKEGRELPGDQQTDEWHYQLFPLPFLDACTFLDRENRCTIYASRPCVCQRFPAGSEQCQEARQRHGIERLEEVRGELRSGMGE